MLHVNIFVKPEISIPNMEEILNNIEWSRGF